MTQPQSHENQTTNSTGSGATPPDAKHANNRFPVAGIGSSAGGLEALQELFRAMPADTGIAFVVVTHQHPGHESILPELLRKETSIPVEQIDNGMRIKPDHIYVLGAGSNVSISDDVLHLEQKAHTSLRYMPIDIFLRSLAEAVHERAIAVILSGTGSDGTLGIKEIKAHGGLIIAQSTSSARYTGMPSSARETGNVDFVESPGSIPRCLLNYLKGPYIQNREERENGKRIPDDEIDAVLRFIRSRIGHDFSSYKRSTI